MNSRPLLPLPAWAIGILGVILVSAIAGTPSTVSATPADTPTPTPTPSPADTPTPNSAPTLQVLRLSRIDVSTKHQSDKAFRLYLGGPASRGAEIPIKLRGHDPDGNLDYLALVDKYGVILEQASCEAGMESECTLVLTMTSPEDWDQIKRVYAVAVDREGASSERTTIGVSTSAPEEPPPLPTPTSTPTPTPTATPVVLPGRPVSVTVPAGESVEVEHDAGAAIEIPMEATEGATTGPIKVSIREVDPPEGSQLEVERVFDFSVVDRFGDDVNLGQPVELTLPYTLPEGKDAADLMVLHWNESTGKWEDAEIKEIDEEKRLVTVETTNLSNWATTFFRNLIEFIRESTKGIVGGNLEPQYDNGLKHLVSLHGEQGLTVPFLPNVLQFGQLKGALILDVDDLARITQEGKHDYVTFWVNVGAELLSGSLLPSYPVGISYSLNAMDHKTHHHDPTFDGEFSLATLSVPTGSLSALNINKNGNISPLGGQHEVCITCTSYVGISFVEVNVNAIKGELNIESFIKLAAGTLETLKPVDAVTAAISPALLATKLLTALLKSFNELDEDVVHPFTYFDDPSPRQLAKFDESLFNRINGAKGGLDRTEDGREDLVFPSLDSEGEPVVDIPLELVVAPDLRESREYYVELLEAAEGWEVKVNPDGQPEDGQDDRYELEADALFPVTTHWLVKSEPSAVDPGEAKFALVHRKNGETETVHEEYTVQLRKERILSDVYADTYSSAVPIQMGETFTYYLTVTNQGPEPAGGVNLHVLGRHGGQPLRSATTPDGPLPCQPVSSEGFTCDLGGLDVGQKIYVQLDFPSPDRLPLSRFVAVPVMLELQSDDEGPQTGDSQLGNIFAVPLVGDPAPENNLAILRTAIKRRALTRDENPNCHRNRRCLTTEIDPSHASQAIREELGENWSRVDWGNLTGRYSVSNAFEALFGLEPAGGSAVHVSRDGAAQDSTGRWYTIHPGSVPGAIEETTQQAYNGLSITLSLSSTADEKMRVLAFNREDHQGLIWAMGNVLFPTDSGGSGTDIATFPSSGGTIPISMRITSPQGLSYPVDGGIYVFGPETSRSASLRLGWPPGIYEGVWSGRFGLPPNPTASDRTYVFTAYHASIPWDVTGRVVVSAYPRWESDLPKIAPTALEPSGGTITVEVATHEIADEDPPVSTISPPSMSISGPGLSQSNEATENESGCAGSESANHLSRCWSTTFDLPENTSTSDQTYVVTISSDQIPVDLTAGVVVPAG